MEQQKINTLTNYWVTTAQHSYKTMLSLFKTKRYADCLFYGHLVIEKILKGYVVQKTKEQAPYMHDLIRLQKIAELNLSDEELNLLDLINTFNIRSRYPEYKLNFYKKCTKAYTENYLKKIIALYKKICQKLKQKK